MIFFLGVFSSVCFTFVIVLGGYAIRDENSRLSCVANILNTTVGLLSCFSFVCADGKEAFF